MDCHACKKPIEPSDGTVTLEAVVDRATGVNTWGSHPAHIACLSTAIPANELAKCDGGLDSTHMIAWSHVNAGR